ncbi:hypothetical protein H5410_017216 [Solanum commersonii]|uniref:Uncharacterized protein n=1 Tax=Solanum commersonii TaxID=4109 RepID=A0A9J5ZYT2_SOLCO|nr:hypothetical protein H5410_017216 [Solanum commersonii]
MAAEFRMRHLESRKMDEAFPEVYCFGELQSVFANGQAGVSRSMGVISYEKLNRLSSTLPSQWKY